MSKQKMPMPTSGNASIPTAATPAAPEQEILPTTIDVRIHSLPTDGAVLARASITLNGSFAVRGIKVVNGENGPFVSMPSYKVGDEYRDVCFPVTKEFREQLIGAVMGAYQQELAQIAQRGQEAPTPEFTAPDMSM